MMIILKLILTFMIWLTYFWLFSFSTLVLMSSMMLFLLLSSIYMFVLSKNQWFTILFVIFLVGGLMVSFFYMVSVDHNNFKNFEISSILICMFVLTYCSLKFFTNYFLEMVLDLNLNSIIDNWKEVQISYLMFAIFILLYLIMVMIFVEKKLKPCKNSIKNY